MSAGAWRCAAAALALTVVLTAAPAVRAGDGDEAYAPPDAVLSDPRAHPDWPCLSSLLQQIVDDQGARGAHVLHVGRVVADADGGHPLVRVYWPRERAILLVSLNREGCADPGYRYDSLGLAWYRGKARIDLDHDVRATQAEVSGSSFLTTRAWVQAVIAECERNGVALTLRRGRRARSADS